MWGLFITFAVCMRFLGNIEAKTDAKGRVFLPASFRKVLEQAGETVLVLRRDVHQKCLTLFPLSVWNSRMDLLLQNVNPFDDESMMLFREFVSAATELTLDGSGRLLIPKSCLEEAEIVQTVRFIGMNNTIEIWAGEKVAKPFMPQADFAEKLKKLMAAPKE